MDASRRHLLATLPFVPAALGEWLLAWQYDSLTVTAARTGAEGPAVGRADVQRVHEAHLAFVQMDHQFGAGLVRPAVTDFMNATLALLLHGSATEQVRSELLSAAARMTRMAGWMAYDLGHQGQAQNYFGQALKLAKTAGDDLTAAWVLATLAQQSCDLGQGQWAVRLAGAATEAGQQADAPPLVRACLHLRQARALSVQAASSGGDEHAARQVNKLLARAERDFATGPSERDPAWIAHFSEAELAGEGGLAWRGIGEYGRAVAHQQQAITGFGAHYPRSVQLTQISVAEGYLGMGEVEQALSSARAATTAAKELTSVRATAFVRDFATRLQPYRTTRHVQEFDDYLRTELAS